MPATPIRPHAPSSSRICCQVSWRGTRAAAGERVDDAAEQQGAEEAGRGERRVGQDQRDRKPPLRREQGHHAAVQPPETHLQNERSAPIAIVRFAQFPPVLRPTRAARANPDPVIYRLTLPPPAGTSPARLRLLPAVCSGSAVTGEAPASHGDLNGSVPGQGVSAGTGVSPEAPVALGRLGCRSWHGGAPDHSDRPADAALSDCKARRPDPDLPRGDHRRVLADPADPGRSDRAPGRRAGHQPGAPCAAAGAVRLRQAALAAVPVLISATSRRATSAARSSPASRCSRSSSPCSRRPSSCRCAPCSSRPSSACRPASSPGSSAARASTTR